MPPAGSTEGTVETSTSITSGALAHELGGELHGPADLPLRGLSSLEEAGPTELTFITSAAFAARWPEAAANVALIGANVPMPPHDPGRRALIVVPDAEMAMIRLLELFAPPPARPEPGVHPSAVVHESARLGQGIRIGPAVTVDRDVRIGDGVTLHAGVRLYPGVEIGDGSELHANVVVRERCRIGRAVVLHAGAVIGTEGFNYRPDPAGGLRQVPHLGNVELRDGVEI
ncbi:MAG: LpxD N-terminal domain-containing protein, partial [Planctomycetota bacterium]